MLACLLPHCWPSEHIRYLGFRMYKIMVVCLLFMYRLDLGTHTPHMFGVLFACLAVWGLVWGVPLSPSTVGWSQIAWTVDTQVGETGLGWISIQENEKEAQYHRHIRIVGDTAYAGYGVN